MASSLCSAKERAEKAIIELDSYKELLSAYTSEWKDLDSFIAEIDRSLALKLEELDAKEKEFEEKNMAMSQALDRREEAIPVREEASLARLHEQQEAAMEKYSKPKFSAEKPASIMAMEESVKAVPEGGKAEIHAKENKIKKKKKKKEDKDNGNEGEGGGEEEEEEEEEEEKEEGKESSNKVRPRPHIVSLCENMDGEGLRKFIVDHRREIVALRNEVKVALHSAIDPSRLVLNALEGYHVLEPDSNHAKEAGASTNRRACILLMECLSEVLSDPVLTGGRMGGEPPVVPPNIKEAAKKVADLWKSRRDSATILSSSASATLDGGGGGSTENSLDAQAFLQLLATFSISSEFEDEEMLKLVYAVCRRKQTPALCRELGLENKMPGFVETLSKDGKQIEALCFAHYFGIMDKIQPGAMLKSYMKEARKAAQETPKNSANPKHESMMKELSAVRAVLKAVEEYKLADQFPTEGLHKRFAQLEKSKADRRKPSVPSKILTQQQKRPRLGMGSQGPSSLPQQMSTDRGQYATASAMPPFGSAYDRRPQAGYNSIYGTDTRSPGSIPNSYLYSADMMSASAYPTAPSAYSGLPAGGYSGYPYGNGLASQTPYPSQFLR